MKIEQDSEQEEPLSSLFETFRRIAPRIFLSDILNLTALMSHKLNLGVLGSR
jgi:hypothetical protein